MHLAETASRARSCRFSARLALGLALLLASPPAWADAIELLQGAWVMESSDCANVFEKIGGEIRFKDRNYALDSGLIITGSKAAGPIAGCTISQVEGDGDRFSALLTCSDALMSRTFTRSFRIVDATHIESLDPDRPDSPMRYKKCAF
jgi:hypothetical protein